MKKVYRVLAYLLAAEVIVQAMAVAYGIAGVGKYVEDWHPLTKAVMDADNPNFQGVGGFMIHGMNGMMVIPLLTIAFLVVSFFTKTVGASKRAGILFGMVALQITLGLSSHGVPALAPLHVLNGFGIFTLAAITGYRFNVAKSAEAPTGGVSVPAQAGAPNESAKV